MKQTLLALFFLIFLPSCCTAPPQLERQTDTSRTLLITEPAFDLSGFGKIESGLILGKLEQDLMLLSENDSIFHFVSVPHKKKNDTLEVFVNPKNNFTRVTYKSEPDTAVNAVITSVEKITETKKDDNKCFWIVVGIAIGIVILFVIMFKDFLKKLF